MNYVRLIKLVGGVLFVIGFFGMLLYDPLDGLLFMAAGGSVFMIAYLWEDPGPIK